MTLHRHPGREMVARIALYGFGKLSAERCVYCGLPARGSVACIGHRDLPALDPVMVLRSLRPLPELPSRKHARR